MDGEDGRNQSVKSTDELAEGLEAVGEHCPGVGRAGEGAGEEVGSGEGASGNEDTPPSVPSDSCVRIRIDSPVICVHARYSRSIIRRRLCTWSYLVSKSRYRYVFGGIHCIEDSL